MSARINGGLSSQSPQNGSNNAANDVHQSKALSSSNDPNLEANTQFFDNFSLGNGQLNGQGEPPFFDSSALTSAELTQDWEYWLAAGDGEVFNSVDLGKSQTALSNLSALNTAQESADPNLNSDTATPDTSPASLDTGAEISTEQQFPTAENPGVLNTKAQKVRLHNIVNERTPVLDEVTSQITSRLGRLQIAEDGQPRYYGATSNLHLLHSGPRSLIQPNIRHVVTHGDAAIAQAGLQWGGDPIYEDLLISLFFSWHNALMYVVDREIFLRERERFHSGQSTDYYSPALENAVYVLLEKILYQWVLTTCS